MAEPTAHHDLDRHPSPMVQEQIARLKFIAGQVDFAGRSVLDIGCGEGLDCRYALEKLGAGRVLGVDVDARVLQRARSACPGAEFAAADACDPGWSVQPGQWDRVLCCEVFEHVPDPDALVAAIARHLADGGVGFISTPNRPVFSLDHRPSPMNRDHLREVDLEEFAAVLRAHFAEVRVWGQRLGSPDQFRARQASVRRNIRDFHLLGRLYWHKRIRHAWKAIRLEPILRKLEGGRKHGHADYEFAHPAGPDSIWLCAVVRREGGGAMTNDE